MRRYWFAAAGLTAAVVVSIFPACGAKTNERTRAAGIVPANTLGLVSINLEPAIEQQRHILSIARALPGDLELKEESWGDARSEFLEGVFEDTDIDFDNDIQPWLGSEIAVAVFDTKLPDAPPSPVLLIDCDDKAKAEASLKDLEDDDALPGPWAFLDDFAAISLDGSEEGLDAIEKHLEGDADSLAQSTKFNGVVDELHGDRLILGYVDGERALGILEEFAGSDLPITGIGTSGPLAFDLHAQAKTLVLEAVTKATGKNRGQPLDFVLPADAIASLSMVGLLDGLREAATEFGPMVEEAIGLDPNEDLLSWIGERVTLVVAPPATRFVPIPRIGLILEVTNEAKAQAAVPKIQSLIDGLIEGTSDFGGEFAEQLEGIQEGIGAEIVEGDEQDVPDTTLPTTSVPPVEPNPFRPTFELVGDQLIISLTPGFVSTLKDLKLAGDGGTPSVFTLYLDANGLAELVEEPEIGEVLDEVRARAGRDGDFDRFELRVTFG